VWPSSALNRNQSFRRLRASGELQERRFAGWRRRGKNKMATKKQTLTRNNLEHKHDLYLEYSDDWALYDVIYRGGSDLIKYAL
jgi:hypothetical protein